MSAQNDSAFLRMFIMILGALVAFTVIILFLANQITETVDEARGPDPRLETLVAERIKPVGSVNVESTEPVSATPQSGAEVAAAACNACHAAGVLGAPLLGDTAAWQARFEAGGGVDGLTATVISGKGSMPPRGGSTASDGEIRAAVEHLLTESGVDVAASAPAPAAAASESPAEAPAAATEPAGFVADVEQMANNAAEVASTAVASVAAAVMPAPSAPASAAADVPPVSIPVVEASDTAATEAAADAAAPAEVAVAATEEAAPAVDLAKGKMIYDTACFACHLAGVAGAPKLGDNAAWAPRIALGMDALNASVLQGKGAMPPKGGRVDLADEDIKAAVAYMVEQAK